MKEELPPINDKWLRIIGYPVVVVVMSLVFGWEEWSTGLVPALYALLISAMCTVIVWEGCRFIIPRIRKAYEGFANTKKRLLIQIPIMVLYTLLVAILLDWFVGYCYPPEFIHPDFRGLAVMLILLIPVAIFFLIYEARYFFEEWKKDIQKTEAMARENLQSQYQALKKQLDPHFLFNSLNTLASLIDHQNVPAQEYLERLSDVYRYILETRNRDTVTLREEMAFLDDYIYLNKVRFQENLRVDHELSPASQDKQLPALSLQLLVENAIKHNIVSRDKPLTIHIHSEQDQLVVENNKQLKNTLGISTKMGLENIMRRYELLNASPITVINQEDIFRVKLPLL